MENMILWRKLFIEHQNTTVFKKEFGYDEINTKILRSLTYKKNVPTDSKSIKRKIIMIWKTIQCL